jgi:AcrR family transcriptional regulator
MGVKERRERQKEMLRQDILDAARELFIQEGYQNVSMRKVAEKIEYSPTTIYLYFKDKAELLFCLCEETFAKLVDTLATLGADHSDPLNCLRKGLRAYVNFGLNYPNHYKVTFISLPEDHQAPEEVNCEKSMGGKAYMLLRSLVAECVLQKRFRSVDVDIATQGLWATVHGITSLLIVHPDFQWADRDAVIDHLIDNAIRGLAAQDC